MNFIFDLDYKSQLFIIAQNWFVGYNFYLFYVRYFKFYLKDNIDKKP